MLRLVWRRLPTSREGKGGAIVASMIFREKSYEGRCGMDNFSFSDIYYFLGTINQAIVLGGSLLAGFAWLVKYIVNNKKK